MGHLAQWSLQTTLVQPTTNVARTVDVVMFLLFYHLLCALCVRTSPHMCWHGFATESHADGVLEVAIKSHKKLLSLSNMHQWLKFVGKV